MQCDPAEIIFSTNQKFFWAGTNAKKRYLLQKYRLIKKKIFHKKQNFVRPQQIKFGSSVSFLIK